MGLTQLLRGCSSCVQGSGLGNFSCVSPEEFAIHKLLALSSGKKEMKHLPPPFFCETDTNPNLLFTFETETS